MDSFETLGVGRNATKKSIKAAYSAKMLSTRFLEESERDTMAQLFREAYRDLMKGFGDVSHLAQRVTHAELESGVLCRCGSFYDAGDAQGNVVECPSCSCSIEII